jgi:hypothetical protein
MICYKLVRKRADGTIGPLFANAKLRIPIGKWMWAGDHPVKGLAHRPGWHACVIPEAPHLSLKGRVWVKCEARHYVTRVVHGGQTWVLAKRLRVLEELNVDTIEHTKGGTRS